MSDDPADGAPKDAAQTATAPDLGPLSRELYFPTAVYFRDFPDAEALNAHLIPTIRALRDQDAEGIERSNIRALGGWHSHDALQSDPDFADFSYRLTATADEISRAAGYDPDFQLQLDNMWAIVNPPGSYNRSHVHPGSLWSGVYYVRAPENAGRIVFYDPRAVNVMQQGRYKRDRRRSAENWVEVYFDPIPGRVILFPSWLYHAVEANTNDGDGPDAERICISFNMYQTRRPAD